MTAMPGASRTAVASRVATSFISLLLVSAVSSCAVGPDNAAESSDSAGAVESSDSDFQPIRLLEPFAPIQDVPLLTVDTVDDEVTDNELVLGVVVNDEARAYPINMLTGPQREIINDQLGGQSIAATW